MSVSHWFLLGLLQQMQSGSQNWNRSVATPHNSMTVKWDTISRKQSDSQITFLGGTVGRCLQISAAILASSFYVTASRPVFAVKSGRVKMLCWFIGWLREKGSGWNGCVIWASLRQKHLWYLLGHREAPEEIGSRLRSQCILHTHSHMQTHTRTVFLRTCPETEVCADSWRESF